MSDHRGRCHVCGRYECNVADSRFGTHFLPCIDKTCGPLYERHYHCHGWDDRVFRVIEWPQAGAAWRFPNAGWWLVEDRLACGFMPIAGPFRTETAALAAKEAHLQAIERSPNQ